MPDVRNLGTIIPGARGADPAPARAGTSASTLSPALARVHGKAEPPPVAPPAAPQSEPPIFAADCADDPAALASDALGLDAPLGLLAELAAHRRAQTPFAIGLLGPSGCGKTVALNKLVQAVERLVAAARGVGSTPFLTRILTLRVSAADLDGDPAPALAAALYARLAADCPELAAKAGAAARDPALAARDAFERLDAARRRLEEERRALEDSESRRAKLADTILYDTPGSQVDAYAGRRRGRIAATMARFGVAGDPLLGYKDMVREVADGGGARTGFAAQAFWRLKGQTKLIVWAVILALIGFGLGFAADHQAAWLSWLRGQPQMAAGTDWIEAHASWLSALRQAAFIGAALALAANLWRGLRLMQLVLRGESLLKSDLLDRRRESDAHYGHQTRRVQDLAANVDRLSALAAEAERRAGDLRPANATLAEPSPFGADLPRQQAQRFLRAAGAFAGEVAAREGPQRILVALDDLDEIAPSRAREVLRAARRLLGPGYVTLLAFDSSRLGDAGETANLEKWIQAPLQVGEAAARQDCAAQLRGIIAGGASADAVPGAGPDAARSALDEPLSEAETKVLAALAPLAGPSARGVKRFANLYRLARAQWPDRAEKRAALALALALDAAGAKEDLAALELAAIGPDGDPVFDHHRIGPRLATALQAATAGEARLGKEDLRDAIAAARLFSFRASPEAITASAPA